MNVVSLEGRSPREMEAVFDAVNRDRPDGILLLADPLTTGMRVRIVEFAREKRLPAIYETRDFVEAGGLMSSGADTQDWMRQSAVFVDKIFKGARPADLPIEQPAKIDLVINARTAAALGLKVPQTLAMQAARVIA